mmetsp:Transcript_16321/g.63666  ORF Transcript_16321/g.63666 Transcript_16321/m.63666 type:complete len:857 (-) Transcript_16321:400-2970(-)
MLRLKNLLLLLFAVARAGGHLLQQFHTLLQPRVHLVVALRQAVQERIAAQLLLSLLSDLVLERVHLARPCMEQLPEVFTLFSAVYDAQLLLGEMLGGVGHPEFTRVHGRLENGGSGARANPDVEHLLGVHEDSVLLAKAEVVLAEVEQLVDLQQAAREAAAIGACGNDRTGGNGLLAAGEEGEKLSPAGAVLGVLLEVVHLGPMLLVALAEVRGNVQRPAAHCVVGAAAQPHAHLLALHKDEAPLGGEGGAVGRHFDGARLERVKDLAVRHVEEAGAGRIVARVRCEGAILHDHALAEEAHEVHGLLALPHALGNHAVGADTLGEHREEVEDEARELAVRVAGNARPEVDQVREVARARCAVLVHHHVGGAVEEDAPVMRRHALERGAVARHIDVERASARGNDRVRRLHHSPAELALHVDHGREVKLDREEALRPHWWPRSLARAPVSELAAEAARLCRLLREDDRGPQRPLELEELVCQRNGDVLLERVAPQAEPDKQLTFAVQNVCVAGVQHRRAKVIAVVHALQVQSAILSLARGVQEELAVIHHTLCLDDVVDLAIHLLLRPDLVAERLLHSSLRLLVVVEILAWKEGHLEVPLVLLHLLHWTGVREVVPGAEHDHVVRGANVHEALADLRHRLHLRFRQRWLCHPAAQRLPEELNVVLRVEVLVAVRDNDNSGCAVTLVVTDGDCVLQSGVAVLEAREAAIPDKDPGAAVEDDDAVLEEVLLSQIHELHAGCRARRVLRQHVHARGVLSWLVEVHVSECARSAAEEVLDTVSEVVHEHLRLCCFHLSIDAAASSEVRVELYGTECRGAVLVRSCLQANPVVDMDNELLVVVGDKEHDVAVSGVELAPVLV